jgi:hypothetical protein
MYYRDSGPVGARPRVGPAQARAPSTAASPDHFVPINSADNSLLLLLATSMISLGSCWPAQWSHGEGHQPDGSVTVG